MLVLGIETSCDETAVALYDKNRGLLSHRIYSQIAMHKDYGGVVPELASRDHIKKTLPLIQDVLPASKKIDGIAYTKGPGLIGALMVGASVAKGLGYALDVPVIGVHHIEAHLMAVMLEKNKPNYPFIALIVSGGHTILLQVNDFGDYDLLGETLDDAVGEAFDKTATLLGLSYPGGPALARLAEKGRPEIFTFPRPMTDRPGFDFSFSGLKTFALNCVKRHLIDHVKIEADKNQIRADIACAFEDAVVDTLLIKSRRALEKSNIHSLVVAGGVSANKKLRERLPMALDAEVFFPRLEFCTDNAAMVAYSGFRRLEAGERASLLIDVRARWPINAFSNIFGQ